MNAVRAVGARARRTARASARRDRGLPVRRRRPAPFPTGRLRDGWPSVSLHRTTSPSGPQLLGTGQPSASLARRGRVPTGLRDLHMVQLPEVAVARPTALRRAEPAAVANDENIETVDAIEAVDAVETADTVVDPADTVVDPADTVETEPGTAEPAAVEPVAAVADAAVADTAVVDPAARELAAAETARIETERAAATQLAATEAARVEAARVEAARVEAERATAPHEPAAPKRAPDTTPHTTPTGAGDTTRVAPRPARADPKAARRRLALVGAALVVAAVGTTAGVLISQESTSPAPTATVSTAAPSTSISPVVAWLEANVPSTVSIVTTDSTLATGLAAGGVAVRTVPDLGAAPAMAVVVTSGSPGAAAPTDPVAISGSRSLVPLALFGVGSDSPVVVGQSVERPAADIESDQDAAATTARSASTGLLDNAAITVTADARPVFEAGQLDLRAAALMAVAAGLQKVQVVAAPVDAAESAAGVAVRRLIVTVADPDSLRSVVSNSRYPYTPTVTIAPAGGQVPDGSLLLTWPILADPALTVN